MINDSADTQRPEAKLFKGQYLKPDTKCRREVTEEEGARTPFERPGPHYPSDDWPMRVMDAGLIEPPRVETREKSRSTRLPRRHAYPFRLR